MLFTGLTTSYPDRCALAVMDILAADSWLRDNFGGGTLAGTASITPATKALTGTSTGWSTSTTDSLAPGQRILLGSQIAEVDQVAGDTSMTIKVAHVNGLVAQPIYRAARGFRVDRPVVPVNISMPFYTVSVGTLPSFEQGIGRFLVNPAVTVAFFYEANQHPLDDTSASWAGLAQHVLTVLSSSGPNIHLCVDRFGGQNLTRRLLTGAPGDALVRTADQRNFITAPAIEVTDEGMDPIAAAALTQEW